jgi:hypothetical protein
MELYKGDKNPIGGTQGNEERVYTKHIIPIDGPTTVYFFSDGYEDQFGGPENKRFMSRNLRELLFNIHKEPFEVQKVILNKTIEDWKGNSKTQIDDILVMGMKVC